MEKNYTIDKIKIITGEIAKRHGVERMFFFGSYARGNAKPGSDLDFRIDKGVSVDCLPSAGSTPI